MRSDIPSVIAVVFLLWLLACGIAHASGAEDSLHSGLYNVNYEDAEVFQKESCQWQAGQSVPQGSRFSDVFPPTAVKTVEVQGDDFALPNPVVIDILTEGLFKNPAHPITAESPIAGRIRLWNGNCLKFNVLVDPSVGRISSVETSAGAMIVPDLAEECGALALPVVKVGMTRVEVEKTMHLDGGFSAVFLNDTYVSNAKCGFFGKVLKVHIAFKPPGMSDEVYRLRKHTLSTESPMDIVMRISPEFTELPNRD